LRGGNRPSYERSGLATWIASTTKRKKLSISESPAPIECFSSNCKWCAIFCAPKSLSTPLCVKIISLCMWYH
jgi:hypothetical protein